MNPQQPNNTPFNSSPAVKYDYQHSNAAQTPNVNPSEAEALPEPPKTSWFKRHHGWSSIISTILLLAIAPLIAFAITAFALQSYQVDGESMETTLQNNDRLIVDKIPRSIARITGHSYIPHRGDIIIFNQANLPDSSFGESKQLIKRVIGLPDEHVVVKNGKITIYNSAKPNGFNPDSSDGYRINAPSTVGDVDITLQSDEIFVCGDNRPNSEDSRYFGPIKTNNIVGKLVLRLLPINKAREF